MKRGLPISIIILVIISGCAPRMTEEGAAGLELLQIVLPNLEAKSELAKTQCEDFLKSRFTWDLYASLSKCQDVTNRREVYAFTKGGGFTSNQAIYDLQGNYLGTLEHTDAGPLFCTFGRRECPKIECETSICIKPNWEGIVASTEECTNAPNKLLCYAFVARNTGNFKICENLPDEISKKQCYEQALGNCDKFKEKTVRDNCYFGIADILGDTYSCDPIENIEKRNECYTVLARKTGNTILCENIEDRTAREKCNG